jgi:hypothetical protein
MRYVWIVALLIVAAGLMGPRLESCGPFFADMLFTTYHHAPASTFEAGSVGVLRPRFYRADLMMAYRTLSGVKLGAGEVPQPLYEGTPADDRVKPWTEARGAFGEPPKLDPDKKVPGEDYQVYPNCLADAFTNAAEMLRKRQAQWGATSTAVKEWVRGQDQVFENCSGGPVIPAEVTSGDTLLRADRQYQIAAAKFYAGQYAEAASAFDAIAKDAGSPWKEIAPYLAARAYVRQGTMQKDEAGLKEAVARLEAILKDPARKSLHGAAQGMLDFVRARLAPVERMRELEKQLMQANLGPQLQRVITDYTQIWDRFEGKPELPDTDLAKWIETFQARDSAVEQWRTKRTTPWLIAALASTDAKDAAAKELIAAARAVPAGSPAWASATYWGIRLSMMSGDVDGARQWADQIMASAADASLSNLVRSERLKLARDWTEFLKFAPRKPAAIGDIDGEGPPTDASLNGKTVAFDLDATEPLNQRTPQTLWMDAAKNDLVPKPLQAEIARAAWVRAILIDDSASARTMAARVAQLTPELAGDMRAYLVVQDPAASRFAAVFLMLRAPGLEPVVRPGFGRTTPILKSDPLRDNWWSLKDDAPQDRLDRDHDALGDLYPAKGPIGPTEFLPAEQRAAAEQEFQKMVDRGANAVNFLADEAIGWATAHPQDPRVPQALHLVVEATHYGPADGVKSKEYSKRAFDILHRKYPASEWAKKTKYWY